MLFTRNPLSLDFPLEFVKEKNRSDFISPTAKWKQALHLMDLEYDLIASGLLGLWSFIPKPYISHRHVNALFLEFSSFISSAVNLSA